jgi:aminopeptidase N
LELSDTTDANVGELTLDVRFVAAGVRSLRPDLINAAATHGGKGMRVSAVTMDGAAVPFTHANDELLITLASAPAVQQRTRVVVRYRGRPPPGSSSAGTSTAIRTFFSDNWPNRARHWLPTIDHPYDKATSEFIVTAPSHYQMVSNGRQVESTDVLGGMASASAILYHDSSVTGTRSVRWRNVVIHEVAHQWFGNAVTEYDWDDIWLSEGFATYFTLLYIEHA